MKGINSEGACVVSEILFHGLNISKPRALKRFPQVSSETNDFTTWSQFFFTECWKQFKLFLLGQADSSSNANTSLLLQEIDTADPDLCLHLSVSELSKLNHFLTTFEDICIPQMLLKFERFKLSVIKPSYFCRDGKCQEEAEKDYVMALKVVASLCSFDGMTDKYLKAVINAREDLDDIDKLRLIDLLHGNDLRFDKRETGSMPGNYTVASDESIGAASEKEKLHGDVPCSSDGHEKVEMLGPASRGRLLNGAPRNSQEGKYQPEVPMPVQVTDSNSFERTDNKNRCCHAKAQTDGSHQVSCEEIKVNQMTKGLNLPASQTGQKVKCSQCEDLIGLMEHKTTATKLQDNTTQSPCSVSGAQCQNSDLLQSHAESHMIGRKSGVSCGLLLHTRSKHEISTFKCDSSNCHFDVKDLRNLNANEHESKMQVTSIPLREKLSNVGKIHLYSCRICRKSFSLLSKYKVHIKSHTRTKTLSCDICKVYSCQGLAKLKRHILTHTGEKPFYCQWCDKSFADRSHLNVHMRSHSRVQPFQCDVCHRSFSESSKLKNHQRIHSGEKPYVCELCGSSFSASSSLKSHLKIHSNQRSHKCKHCDFAAVHPSNLKAHLMVHTAEKKYFCDRCGAAFSEMTKLNRHKMVHSGERPYSCEVCGTRFADKSHLTVHLRIHSGEKPFKCTHCPAAFIESSKLKNHLRTHTGEKPYVCEVCGMSFAVSYSLKSHMRRHTGEKPYKCEICGYATSQSSNLKTHMLVHNGNRPHICSECGASFSEASKLNRHRRVHVDVGHDDCENQMWRNTSLLNQTITAPPVGNENHISQFAPHSSLRQVNIGTNLHHHQNHTHSHWLTADSMGSTSADQRLTMSTVQQHFSKPGYVTNATHRNAETGPSYGQTLHTDTDTHVLHVPVPDTHVYHPQPANHPPDQHELSSQMSDFTPSLSKPAGNSSRLSHSSYHFLATQKEQNIVQTSAQFHPSSL